MDTMERKLWEQARGLNDGRIKLKNEDGSMMQHCGNCRFGVLNAKPTGGLCPHEAKIVRTESEQYVYVVSSCSGREHAYRKRSINMTHHKMKIR